MMFTKTVNDLIIILIIICFRQINCNYEEQLLWKRPINREDVPIRNHWALLVAGSSGWYNYRHQADVYHAYQIMLRHGISHDHIILMAYDDIAYNHENPTPGIVINHPNGTNVYDGVKIDYTMDDVTPKNFLSILKGDKMAMSGIGSGRVIESGPNDRIFVNFADHGAPGLVAFPNGELYATELNHTIYEMHLSRKYREMLLYVEACESGSMFNDILPSDINVFATTASSPNESSYAVYFDPVRQTYLGDVYSVRWMEDSDKENLNLESLEKQFQLVQEETNTSHVQQYGDMKISREPVSHFQGSANSIPVSYPSVPFDAVPSGDVPFHILAFKAKESHSIDEYQRARKNLMEHIKARENYVEVMSKVVRHALKQDEGSLTKVMTQRNSINDLVCYERVVREYDKVCFDLSKHEFALRQLNALVNLCNRKVPKLVIIQAIQSACGH